MEEWKEYTLGEIANIQTGPFGSQLHNKDYVEDGTPIVTVEHLGSKKFTTQNLPCVTSEDRERLKKYSMEEGDVIFSRVGSVDRCSYVDSSEEGWLFSGRCLRVRPSNRIFPLFLYYYLCQPTIKRHIRNIAVGATMPSINTQLLSEVPIKIPALQIQERIALILSSLDDKIELNRKINSNLEEQAKALFKSWFIDFEPFKDGNFVDSELGLIPEALPLVHIEDIPHIIEAGKRPKGGAVENGLPSIGAENIKGLGNYDYSKTKYIPVDFAKSLVKGKINGYELLIYKDGGKPGYFIPNFSIFGEGFPYEEMFINEHVFKLNLTDDGYNAFAYFFMQTKYIGWFY